MRTLPSLALLACSVASLGAQIPPPETLVAADARTADSIMIAAESRGFSGVALFIRDGAPVLRKAYGLAQRETKTRFAPNTVVQIGSNTKDFTAVAILQLMVRGRLRLEDSLAKFFPGAPPDKRSITLWQLLRHRSGVPIGVASDSERVTREAFLARVMRAPLQFRPGDGEQYSNAGYSLLAAIIEQLASTSYDAFVRDNILAPLGMRETGYLLPNFSRARLAHGYSADGDRGTVLDLSHLPNGPSWSLRGNGGMLSTVTDMATFYSVLLGSERLLPAAARNRIFDPLDAMVLAGSDRTSYFVYQHEPVAKLDLFLVSTSTEVRAPQLLRQIAPTLGFREEAPDDAAAANAPEIQLPLTNAGRVVRDYLDVFNGADSASAVRFFSERFVSSDNAPPLARYDRLRQMRENLGKLVPIGFKELSGQPPELRARTVKGEVATILFEIESEAPYRIRSLRVRVGG